MSGAGERERGCYPWPMTRMASSLKGLVKRIVVGSRGAGGPDEEWTPPGPGEVYGSVSTSQGPVRVAPPRGRDDAGAYPEVPPAEPERRVPGEALPRDRFAWYPKWHVGEHPTSWTFPASLDNPSCRWLQTLKRMYAMKIAFPASLSPDAGLLLHSLVRNIRPRTVVETGTFIGMSTLWMAAAMEEAGGRDWPGVIHTFDDFGPIAPGPWREVGMESGRLSFVAGLLADAGLAHRVVLHPGNSWFEIRAWREAIREEGSRVANPTPEVPGTGGSGVQLAYLDADHTLGGVTQDLWAVEPIVDTGGFVILHDTFPEYCGHDGPRALLDTIDRVASEGLYEKVDLYLSPVNYGLAVLRRVG